MNLTSKMEHKVSLKNRLANLHIIVGKLFISFFLDSRRKQSQAEETTLFEHQAEVGSTVPKIHQMHFLFSFQQLQ